MAATTQPHAFAAPPGIFGAQEFLDYVGAVRSTFCRCLLDVGDATTALPGEFGVHPLLEYHSVQTHELTNFTAVNSGGLLRIWTLVYKMGIFS